jgi:hypothetical protein
MFVASQATNPTLINARPISGLASDPGVAQRNPNPADAGINDAKFHHRELDNLLIRDFVSVLSERDLSTGGDIVELGSRTKPESQSKEKESRSKGKTESKTNKNTPAEKVTFDQAEFRRHGRIKNAAENARAKGLNF